MLGEENKEKEERMLRLRFVRGDLASHFYCAICQQVFTDPVFIQCGHVFCRTCIGLWLNNSNSKCPECRASASAKHVAPAYIVRQIIGEEEVHCLNPGCTAITKLTRLDGHLRDCKFDPQKLPRWLA